MVADFCVSQHRAAIYERGGRRLLFNLPRVTYIQYARERDEVSNASIGLTALQCSQQAEVLSQIEPMRHELVIFEGEKRRWEGPITLATETRNGMELDAKDVLYYAHKTAMRAAYNNAYPNIALVVERARQVLVTELARKEALDPPINVVPYIVDHQEVGDARTSASTVPMEYRVLEHLDNLAANSGLDYTVVGRAIHLWDTHRRLGQTPTVTEQDILGDLIVSRYGSELATVSIVTDGQGNYGIAGATDPYYGEIEDLHTAYDEESNDAPPTASEMVSQAQRNLVGKNPVPLILRIPDNSTVNPKGVLSMDNLVPGVYIPLRAKLLVRTYSQMQKLDRVVVREDQKGSSVKITLSPAAATDTPEEE